MDGDLAIVGTSFDLADGGRVRVEQDGSFIFNPDGDFEDLNVGQSRTVSVVYGIADPEGLTDTATARFTVRGENDAPTAVMSASITKKFSLRKIAAPRLACQGLVRNTRGGATVHGSVPNMRIWRKTMREEKTRWRIQR